MKSTSSSLPTLRHGTRHMESTKFLVSRKGCIFWANEQALQTVVAVCRFHSTHAAGVLTVPRTCFVLSTTIHPEVRYASFLPASHKTLTSFLLHYKFKIYLQNIKSLEHDKCAEQEQESLGLSPLSVNLFGRREFVRWKVFSTDLPLSEMDDTVL